MNPKKYLGIRLFLRLLVSGAAVGFLAGYLAEQLIVELEGLFISANIGPLVGVGIGIIISVVTYLVANRSLFSYITALRDKMADVGDLPFGFEDDLKLADQAGALYGLFEYEVERLNKARHKMLKLSQNSRETIKKAQKRDSVPLQKSIFILEKRCEEARLLKQRAQQLKDWVKEAVLPVMKIDFQDIRLQKADAFENMINFQKDLDKKLNETSISIEQFEKAIKPWEEGPRLVRDAVQRANQLIYDMAELFRKFPAKSLPEKAEKLRISSQEWEQMADKIEKGIESLEDSLLKVKNLHETMARNASQAAEPLSLWNEVKAELNTVDNKVTQLKEATGEHWARSLGKQIKSLESQAEWFDDTLGQLHQQLKQDAEVVEELDELAAELAVLAPSGES